MIPAGSLGGALLLLAAQPLPSSVPGEGLAAAAAHFQFAPPVGQPMTYRVTTRRIGREGALINFSLTYALQWQRVGRGYRLEAVMQRIDSDARPEVTRALSLMLEPLVGEPTAYLVAPDGSRVDLVDPDRLWARVTARIEAVSAESGRPEARQLAQLVAALPAGERDRLASADIRALVAPANGAIPVSTLADGASVSMMHDGALQTIAKVERDSAPVAGTAKPLEIDNLWTVDTSTGLVMREQRQSWIIDAEGDGRTLVEERVRALEFTPEG
ncbi:hypothetical protein SKP52_03230 [Sphingopyxis fribergensis]|uniref:Uncharacterized protein n=1 Tax=Sphingopyxis fribergensis TaxID=1515612 RepID=A0A0A7PC42_9SPHN|nr:hypothetical protein [Sphingopyxis fribergensis]AJA07575.1 hypothetical protein SKP52_03230 [Sphingopyxis fribergensis]